MINRTGTLKKTLNNPFPWHAFLHVIVFLVALMAPLAGYAEDINSPMVLAPPKAEKILARQFVLYAEKSGKYQLDILFSPGEEINNIVDFNERFTREREVHRKALYDLEGRILVFDLQENILVQEIFIPTQEKTKTFSSLYIIDEDELGELYPAVDIPHQGRYLIRPEIFSHYPEFTDYTLYFVRVRYK
ncbi:hypothetical protein J5069_12260 [Candidatus Symbiopectobacterium sp. NZEC127]|uniref:hypothetical protein n=1 Tax=Candidatus Symbiopectobacterium sp. NZEC127 TaxID=2820472 RepID=UPI0022266A4B|nr:hypothetical protein [Candidatus Symbiopectobacterium sp. NZEC127]MCW2486666.1 hypothetical protein [Candidatus Symbiopectobacterium sp. NZEC127]